MRNRKPATSNARVGVLKYKCADCRKETWFGTYNSNGGRCAHCQGTQLHPQVVLAAES